MREGENGSACKQVTRHKVPETILLMAQMLPFARAMNRPQVKVGIDVTQISHFERLVENRAFLDRTFHPSELLCTRPESLAGIFAAKEAFFKALGLTPRWLQVEVAKLSTGKPSIQTARELALDGLLTLDISITHEGDYAIAVVVMLFDMGKGP